MRSQHGLHGRASDCAADGQCVEGPMIVEQYIELWQALDAVAELIQNGTPALTAMEVQ